jgi:hypothetical protein
MPNLMVRIVNTGTENIKCLSIAENWIRETFQKEFKFVDNKTVKQIQGKVLIFG